MPCPADLTPSTHFLRFVQSSECEWIAVLRVTRGTHQFSLDFLSKWLEMSCSQKEPRVRIPNSPPKTQSYQGFCQYDWAFLFSQGHIGVHDFRQELRCASRSAPAASPAPPAGNRPQCTAASWGAPPCRRGEGKLIHFDGVFQCLVDYFFSRHPNLGKLGLTKGRIYAIHE